MRSSADGRWVSALSRAEASERRVMVLAFSLTVLVSTPRSRRISRLGRRASASVERCDEAVV
eukprot:2984582-Prymnesium_polylepis.1